MRHILMLALFASFGCQTSHDKKLQALPATDSQHHRKSFSPQNDSARLADEIKEREKRRELAEPKRRFTKLNKEAALVARIVKAKFRKWHIFDYKVADLNLDGTKDVIMVLQKFRFNEDLMDEKTWERKAVIFVNNGANHFEVAAISDGAIPCSSCGGMAISEPFESLKVGPGVFTIETLFGGCTKSLYKHTFRYSIPKANWYLVRAYQLETICPFREDSPDEPEEVLSITTPKDFGRISFSEHVI